MEKQEVIEAFCIMLLALVVAVSLLTMTRTCEILENGKVNNVNCSEIDIFEK